MKALEAHVSALCPSQHSSPTSASAASSISAKQNATKPAAAKDNSRDVDNSSRDGPSSSLTFKMVAGVALADTAQTGQHSSANTADTTKFDGALHGGGYTSAAATAEGRADAGSGAAGRQVASTAAQGRAAGNIPVPDLMTFSPADHPAGSGHPPAAVPSHPVSLLQPAQQATPHVPDLGNSTLPSASTQQQQQQQQGLPLVSSRQELRSDQKLKDAAFIQQSLPSPHSLGLQQPKQQTEAPQLHQLQPHDVAVRAGLQGHAEQGHWRPDSQPGSPLPAGSFYDNAVFGSPTPTPSPQGGVLGSSQALLSPGSSPRPQQQLAGALLSRTAGKLASASVCLLAKGLAMQQAFLTQCKAPCNLLELHGAAQSCCAQPDRSVFRAACKCLNLWQSFRSIF